MADVLDFFDGDELDGLDRHDADSSPAIETVVRRIFERQVPAWKRIEQLREQRELCRKLREVYDE